MGEAPQATADDKNTVLRQLCRHLYEHSPSPLVVANRTTGIILYANPAFGRLVGRESPGLVHRRLTDALPDGVGTVCMELLQEMSRSGLPETRQEQEHRGVHPQVVCWSYAAWPIGDAEGSSAAGTIEVTDVTEAALFRRRARALNEALLVSAVQQHELREANALSKRLQADVQIRDHFLAVLSHELRNPLAALTAGLYLLKPDGRTGTALQSHEMMERQLKLLVRLVDDLLEVSRITTGKLVLRKQPVDFNAVLNDAVDACRPMILRLGHELTFTAPEGEIILEADPTRLAQVFMNLLNNAAEYSERGHIAVHAERRGSEVVVRVSDTGIGISAAQLPHVFDAFMQVEPAGNRAHAGLGIGLSLVKEFVVLHGGSVEAHSEGPGKGSEFVVRLPASSSVPVAEVEPVAETTPRGPRRRILIVEDNRDAAESLAMLLKLTGHHVQVAYDGNEGVAAAAEFRPELVLMDLGMPHMDGYEAARRMRAGPGGDESILVALTGWGADHDRRRAQESGFDQHLIKPVDPDALTRMIEQMPIKPS